MPDSGIISSMSPPPHHSQNPPFYSPPAPPPHHHGPPGGGGGNGGMMEENYYHHHHHLSYNGDSDMNSNSNNSNGGGNYPRGGGGGGGGGRTVSFSGSNNNNNNGNNNNPNDPNNNSGMMIMMEDDGGGGPGGGGGGGDMLMNSFHQRDLFEEIRNGGGHWSQLLRQVVLNPPPTSVLDDYSPSEEGGRGGGGKDDPMTGDGGENRNSGGDGDNSATNNGGVDNERSEGGGDGGNLNQNSNNSSNHMVPLQIVGGSENGQFVYVGITTQDINRWITVGYLQPGDIILEIQGQQVAGYTQSDVISLLHLCLRGNSATLTVAPRGSLGPELRSYLNTRFQKGSVDHALQGVVRDNLYLRTVPVTTRSPRPGEVNGVDYTFLSVEEFMELERNGSLLESGVYAGNHYGTPKPWARLSRGVIGGGGGGDMIDHHGGGGMEGILHHNSMMMLMEGGGGGGNPGGKGPILPGMHPSSEGKRRRNRSNVEALGAGGDDDNGGGHSGNVGPPQSPPQGGSGGQQPQGGVELGPLPANWEMAYTDNGEVYFIDHNTGTSHWLDPRLSRVQKMSLEECAEDELPFGWERIEDPHYGVYYIDHVNRRTQFENPVIQAKQQAGQSGGNSSKGGGGQDRNGNNGMSTDSEADSTSKFLPNHNHQDHPPPHQPPPPPHNHHLQQYLQPPQKRPTSLAKPVPPVPNPKPQNRLSISQQQRTKTPVNEMEGGGVHHLHDGGNTLLPAFPSSSSAGSSGGLRVKPVHDSSHGGRPSYRFFTRDPSQLIGERIVTTLVKSNRGLGFTIVGGDDDDGLDEFLQIKSVVTDGPAWNDGKLRTGDVLVKVNGTCVLGYTHQEMVSIFQSISPGQDVQLEVCRGYPLPFDPADPNTEIVTTVAVAPLLDGGNGGEHLHHHHHHHQKKHVDWARPGTPDSLTHSAHSLPELSNDRLVDFGGVGGGKATGHNRPASVDLLLDSPKGQLRFPGGMFLGGGEPQHQGGGGQQAVLIVNIAKGNQGFGFTIADSVTGQKVKKVLDAGHCGELEEGDRLIALDGLDLRGLSHTQVVQILKDFPVGREASLTIQRTPPNSPYNGSNNGGGGGQARFFGGGGYMDTPRILPPPTRPPGISPRSKTPTAELARGRPRLRDNLPERPKTPQGMLGEMGGGRGDYSGLFNGDMGGGPQLFSQHQFLGGNNNGGDGHPQPPSNLLGGGGGGNSDLNLGVVRDWLEMTIELQRRQEGFGFRIVGGTEEGSQVSVGHIVPGGAAALDGRLMTGDQLIAVEGCSVIGASHRSVVQLMARSANQGKVRLTVRRPIYQTGGGGNSESTATTTLVVTPIHSPGGGGGSVTGGSISSSQQSSPPLHVTLRRQPSEGFGFVIISSASKAGATIGKIVEGSPADRCGELHVGDRILAVNSMDISQLHHTQVVQLIKESGFVLTLSVLPVGGGTIPTTPTGGPPSHIHSSSTLPMSSPGGNGGGTLAGQLSNLTLQQQQQLHSLHQTLAGGGGGGMQDGMENLSLKDGSQQGDMGTAFISPEGHTIHFGSNHSANSSYPDGGHEQVFSVHLSRGNRGFGFSIRGGKEFQNMPLFVLRLADDGPAAMDGRMQVGDQILQINGINTHGMTHAQAIHLIKTGGASVHLLLRRGSVPFPFLNQMPNLTGGFGTSNGQELEEQSMSNASNNNSVEQPFISQSQNAAQLYRDHHHHAGF